MMHLSMCLLQLLACCLPAWVVLIIHFIIRSNAVLNCELGPIKMFYIALQIIRFTTGNSPATVISVVETLDTERLVTGLGTRPDINYILSMLITHHQILH